MLDWSVVTEELLPLLTAALLGGLIGLEREMRGQWAGLRTHILVAIGAALFTLTGVAVARMETAQLARVIQGVATGIGFIGAGTILKLTDALEIRGLTTASSIWLAAAVGTAAGIRMYSLAVIGTLLTVAVLHLLTRVDKRIQRHEDGKSSSIQD